MNATGQKELNGEKTDLNTEAVITSSRNTLKIQEFADYTN